MAKSKEAGQGRHKRGRGHRQDAATRSEPENSVSGETRVLGATHTATGASPRRDAVPPAVRDRFLVVGREYFFPDGEVAFKDRGARLSTRSENTEVVRAMLEIAAARQWGAVSVSGSERFRRAAWEAGMRAGVAVRGYTASQIEELRVQRRGADRAERTARQSPPKAAEVRKTGSVEAPASDADRRKRAPLIHGELLAHGRATYQFHPQEQESYYVRLKTPDGAERTVWGKDLERAFAESTTRPGIGDAIGVQPMGRERVTVRARKRGADGELEPERDVRAHRNRWVVERLEVFENGAGAAATLRDTRIDAAVGVERHPELADAYLHLRAAERLAAQRIHEPEQRAQFVAMVREALAEDIRRGDRVPPARLRGHRDRADPLPPIRHQEPLQLSR